jgi:hypothetical protein
MISVFQLTLLVCATLILTAIAPITLLVLFFRDLRDGTVW